MKRGFARSINRRRTSRIDGRLQQPRDVGIGKRRKGHRAATQRLELYLGTDRGRRIARGADAAEAHDHAVWRPRAIAIGTLVLRLAGCGPAKDERRIEPV